VSGKGGGVCETESRAVRVNSNESANMVLEFGVPQGSVLGPKFFID